MQGIAGIAGTTDIWTKPQEDCAKQAEHCTKEDPCEFITSAMLSWLVLYKEVWGDTMDTLQNVKNLINFTGVSWDNQNSSVWKPVKNYDVVQTEKILNNVEILLIHHIKK